MNIIFKLKIITRLSIFLSFFIFSFSSLSSVTLNLGVVHKRGLDKSLTLVSEVYSREEISVGQSRDISLNHGMTLTLKLRFAEPTENYGPSKRVMITANLNLQSGDIFLPNSSETFTVNLGEEKKVIYEKGKDQRIEISIQPEII